MAHPPSGKHPRRDLLLHPSLAAGAPPPVAWLGPRLALLSSADATAEWRAACSSAQRMVVLGEHNGAAEVHVLVRGLCEETSPELARRVSDAHALLCAFVCEPALHGDDHHDEGGAPSRAAAGTSDFACGRSLAVQRWQLTVDAAGRVSGVRVELPLVELGRAELPATRPPHSGARHKSAAASATAAAAADAAMQHVLPSSASGLFAPLWGIEGAVERQRRRAAQVAGREALQRLMRMVGMAPVEQEEVLALLNGIARLAECRFYCGSGSGSPLVHADEHAAKAWRAAAGLLGVDDSALRGLLGLGGIEAQVAEQGARQLARELHARLVRWVAEHVNLALKHAVRVASSSASTTSSSSSASAPVKTIEIIDATGGGGLGCSPDRVGGGPSKRGSAIPSLGNTGLASSGGGVSRLFHSGMRG
jgi:hypothetical protein